ncbi:peptide chain release factor 1 [Spiroplasma turonicum]|uniref:Peptide chain release factor 1 n=1 Tax=Spiroplasma turonicum TaxID=216946 RepID=A0A0K1P7M6_9MOLU|nr:peptide chain release factor 1 [Spiroplasma turonicum]AKU80290.1 peptide chain release factor 1 [Spiroplasma turonicum]ALX71291.1 peptide chain release factor 1 [Spiroplasma turonicum]
MNAKTLEALNVIEKRVNMIDSKLQDEANLSDIKLLTELNKERSSLESIYNEYLEYKKIKSDLDEANYMLKNEKDAELKQLAKSELQDLEEKIETLEKNIELLLLPKDPNDDKNVVFEIRGAAGGDEANIFAGDLFRLYTRYAEKNNWKVEVLEESESTAGGFSQISFMVKGDNVYSKMKFESGSHRVQRVPKTESKGRIQTSTATVAVLPEVSDLEVDIKLSDLRIDTYRSSGAGGQHVNTTDSAVRVTHIPTGIVASSQDGRSQHDNKDKAMTMLRARIYEYELQKKQEQEASQRKSAVGTGARSEKIRTYNYPQNRITDHRINLTLSKLDQVMEGNLEEIIDGLIKNHQKELIAEQINEDN